MRNDLLDAYAVEVGRLCNGWAALESSITNFAMNLLRTPFRPASFAMMRCYDPRQHIAAIKVGAALLSENKKLVALTIATFDYIDNQLRPRRNRFVHDRWTLMQTNHNDRAETWVELANTQPKVYKLPHDEKMVIFGTNTRYETSDIAETTMEVNEHAAYLNMLAVGFTMAPTEPLPEQISKPPQRRYLPPPQEKQDRSGNARKGRASPPKSSQE